MVVIDAAGMYYRDLNRRIREHVARGEREFLLENVNGQYYICDGITEPIRVTIHGVPGQDLGAFMSGPVIHVYGNGQDNIGNTMNAGKIVVHGHGGDVVGYGMRGGKIFIQGDVGYRVGIHMKGYLDQVPVLIVGGKAGDFFGEYMAGGVLILLGMTPDARPVHGDYLGTGMHGGTIYVRGEVDRRRLGKGVGVVPVTEEDRRFLEEQIREFSQDVGMDAAEILSRPFTKLVPLSSRPYGSLYASWLSGRVIHR